MGMLPQKEIMKEKSVIVTILCCLVALLTVLNLGLYATNRFIAKQQQERLVQIQQQITNRDGQVQQLIGQLKATKTIQEVKEVLGKIQ